MRRETYSKRLPASFKMWSLAVEGKISVFGDGTPVISVSRGDLDYMREDESETIQRVTVTIDAVAGKPRGGRRQKATARTTRRVANKKA